MSGLFASYYREAIKLHKRKGPPKREDRPEHAEQRRKRDAAWAASELEAMQKESEHPEHCHVSVATTEWADLLEELTTAYRDWLASIEQAIALLPATSRIMDDGEPRLAERWTTKLRVELRDLMRQFHWTVVGKDGMGLVGTGCPPIPGAFSDALAAIGEERLVLMDVTRQTVRGRKPGKDAAKSDLDSGKAKWVTVTEAHLVASIPTYEITRLANSKRLKTNGKTGRPRRILVSSLAKLKLEIYKDETLKRLRKWVR